MNLTEKAHLFHGSGDGYVGNVEGIPRLGIPAIRMNDGPQGYRDNAHPGSSTAWPCSLAIGATFDRAAAYAWGAAMGDEFFRKGSNVQLGPAVCLARVPRNGRNFEYLSGEDPYLGYVMVQPVVTGIQSQEVVANVKVSLGSPRALKLLFRACPMGTLLQGVAAKARVDAPCVQMWLF
jgi:beta-glucosidase